MKYRHPVVWKVKCGNKVYCKCLICGEGWVIKEVEA